MGISKSEEFTAKDNKISNYAKALSHPARIAILKYLSKRRSCVCGDIVINIPLSQSTISQHLKELKNAGLVKGDVEGKNVCYCINEKEWSKVKKTLTDFLNITVDLKDGCC